MVRGLQQGGGNTEGGEGTTTGRRGETLRVVRGLQQGGGGKH